MAIDQTMNESGNDTTPSESNVDTVRRAELAEIVNRRRHENIPSQDADKNLVGLALSGGGLRSGAVSLGVLQALHRRGVLPFIDYLSTVSGGGYAGAYLSSQALRAGRQAEADNAAEELGRAPDTVLDQCFPIASSANDKQSQRMMEFIYGGSYLRKTWVFFNRYVIGLFLLWTVVLSGTCALAALTVWAFQWLYFKPVMDWLAALSFADDLTRSMFPSFCLLILWLIAWGVSYFKFGPRATGSVARYLFYLLIITTGVAIAAVLGSGDIDLTMLSGNTNSIASHDTANSIGKTIQTVLISAIIASLIPYLSPKLLVRSGASPRGAVEKYTFWIASRALVYGVPFLLVSFFARENISRWNQTRDSSLVPPDIKNWNDLDPRRPEYQTGVPQLGLIWSPVDAHRVTPFFTNLKRTELEATERTVRRRAMNRQQSSDLLPNQHDVLAFERARTRRNSLATETLPTWTRWYHFVEFPWQWLLGGDEHYKTNPVYRIADAASTARFHRERLIVEVNQELRKPHFYQQFLPLAPLDNLLEKSKGNAAKETWVNDLKGLREQAEKVAKTPLVARNLTPLQAMLAQQDKERAVVDINRKLLQVYYPNTIGDKSVVYSYVVWYSDQQTRLTWFLWSAGIFLIVSTLVDLNATSWHGFYASQIANMWIEKVPGLGRDIPLAQLDTTDHGRPYHLISGAVHLLGKRKNRGGFLSRDRFLFSKLYCGSDRLAYLRTSEFMGGTYTLADAIAVSGGAVSPAQTTNPLVLALLFLGNLRLGQWVANPAHRISQTLGGFVSRWPVTPFRVLVWFAQPAERRPFCFVTDGGHHENLGIEPLLERRCRLILASDAGQDETHMFADFTRLVSRARLQFGIRFEPLSSEQQTLALHTLVPEDDSKRSQAHFVIARIRYPDQAPDAPASYLIYMKSSLTGDEGHELLQFQRFNPAFPHDPTADQFYDPRQFDAYRQLGFHISEKICENLGSEPVSHTSTVDHFINRVVGLETPLPAEADDVAPEVNLWLKVLENVAAKAEDREEAASKLEDAHHRLDLIVPALIRGLESRHESLRKTCSLVLETVAKRCAPKLLLPGLRHELPQVQQAVALIIAEIFDESAEPDQEVITALVKQLRHQQPTVRKAATSALQAYCREYHRDPDHHERVMQVRKKIAT